MKHNTFVWQINRLFLLARNLFDIALAVGHACKPPGHRPLGHKSTLMGQKPSWKSLESLCKTTATLQKTFGRRYHCDKLVDHR